MPPAVLIAERYSGMIRAQQLIQFLKELYIVCRAVLAAKRVVARQFLRNLLLVRVRSVSSFLH